MKKYKIVFSVIAILFIGIFLMGCIDIPQNPIESKEIPKFSSCSQITAAFKDAQASGYRGYGVMKDMAVGGMAPTAAENASGQSAANYSTTNIQVQGVDEADIVKNDGKYIYTLSNGNLTISDVFPAENAQLLSKTELKNFSPQEMFLEGDYVLIFGSKYEERVYAEEGIAAKEMIVPPYYYSPKTSVQIWNASDKENPEMEREIEFEGNYLNSRKIGNLVYFAVNSYPNYTILETPETNATESIVPVYRDSSKGEEFESVCGCADIGYLPPIQANSFVTLASIDMTNPASEIIKETVVGTGDNVYASLDNFYLAEVNYNWNEPIPMPLIGDIASSESMQETIVHKFALSDGQIAYQGNNSVPGTILNQYSMDEFNDNFRIATTISGYSNNKDTSTNNIYVLDKDLALVGKVEGIAPGESIYSVRFMGERAYMVTFLHVDPLFVIDLSDPSNPQILGKLKIPGYSDYLHPFDETHIIGIGKEVDASIDADKVHTEGAVYYTAIQGVKISIFDVSDVSNPVEMFKEVIGDRGTESLATSDPKAFLFDKEKELLVVPLTVAELKAGQDKSEQGDFTFQGAYVYKINLTNGLQLKGKITHYDSDEDFKKMGYYYYGGANEVKRSLYMDNTLYTISDNKIKANNLDSMDEISTIILGTEEDQSPVYRAI